MLVVRRYDAFWCGCEVKAPSQMDVVVVTQNMIADILLHMSLQYVSLSQYLTPVQHAGL